MSNGWAGLAQRSSGSGGLGWPYAGLWLPQPTTAPARRCTLAGCCDGGALVIAIQDLGEAGDGACGVLPG
jgi:hypothetical protein